MSPAEPAIEPSKSITNLEKEVYILRLKLQRAEDANRTLQSAAIELNQHKKIEESLRLSEARLEMELADTKLLQGISAHLIQEDNINLLYEKIVEAAVAITQSDFASLQMFYPERGTAGELRLLASSGLTQEGKDFWAWVGVESGTTCAVALRTGQRFIASDIPTCEFIVGTPDHKLFDLAGVLAAQSTPLYSRSGKLLGMISTHWKRNYTPSERSLNLLDILARQAADLIERKHAEDALLKSQLALVEADRRKDEFLATIAHELRNPLAPICNALHILRNALTGNSIEKMVAMMERQAAHLVRLVDDLMDISRIRQGKIELRKERIALQDAARDAIESSHPLMEHCGHNLQFVLPEKPVWVYADLTRITQVLINLLNNAAKYTPSGGRISLNISSEKNNAVITIADNGLGIPSEKLPKIFDLYTQIETNDECTQGGLGIGLALVKRLLEMHDGAIEVMSAGQSQGSTFTVRLPLAMNF